jgi:hypothetical protein
LSERLQSFAEAVNVTFGVENPYLLSAAEKNSGVVPALEAGIEA